MGGKHPSKFALLLEGIKITPTTSRITLGNYTPIDNIVTTDTQGTIIYVNDLQNILSTPIFIHDSKGLYNVKDINVGKGLITTIFNNVYFDVTTNQNFFIITTKGYEIHLAHYNPLDKYNTDKEKKADGVYVSKNSNITYMSSEGKVWGIKVPTARYRRNIIYLCIS